jgi:hypothetical protein
MESTKICFSLDSIAAAEGSTPLYLELFYTDWRSQPRQVGTTNIKRSEKKRQHVVFIQRHLKTGSGKSLPNVERQAQVVTPAFQPEVLALNRAAI